MTLIRWEPFKELDDYLTRYSPLLGRLPAGWPAAQGGSQDESAARWAPAANISETDSEYLIKAELPEVSKEDVKVTVDDGVITISGERRQVLEHDGEKQHRVESFYGHFRRSFPLPEDANPEGIKAESRNGVLKLWIPKRESARARSIEVQVN